MFSIEVLFTMLRSAALAVGVVLLDALYQVARRYTLPNIGYHKRRHGQEVTFFVRNLDSIEYRKPLVLRVHSPQLRYVSVQAGPWCNVPPEFDHTAPSTTIKVEFLSVPEDAVFIIRAHATRGDVSLRIHPDSPLTSRHSFETSLPPFEGWSIIRYYASRYLLGLFVFAAVFIGSVLWADHAGAHEGIHALDAGDCTIAALGVLVSYLAFRLVVPHEGKSTIGGYESGVSVGLCWPDERTVIETQDATLRLRRRGALHA